MELRDIEYFAAIADHGHLGRAADALGLSQPALSKSLRRLEDALRTKLVKRTPKGVELTAEGSVLLLRARELRLSLRSVAREIADVSEGRAGQLRIGVGFPRPEAILAATFAAMLKDAPRTSLVVTISDNDVMVPALRTGELDLIFNYLSMTSSPEGLVRERLYDDEQVVCASISHRLAGRRQVTLADLAQEMWAVSALTQTSQLRLQEAFRGVGLPPPQLAFECRSPRLKLQTVASSDLLDWTSRRFVEQSSWASAIRILPIKELVWVRPIGLIYRREAYLPPAVYRFIEIIKAKAKDAAVPA
jgi:DNA-binding transcriptional LysR family regulator